MTLPIDRAVAKNELERINGVLEEPYILIGGLAVQQYYAARDSKDIDLVCPFEVARRILEKLYPSRDWKVEDKHQDEYRPSFQIKHKVEDLGTIIFGPKISERAPYNHLDWNALRQDAKPFRTAIGELENILVPSAHSLAYTKFISFLGRQSPEDKIAADLKDFTDLTNHELFSVSQFYDLLRKTRSFEQLITNFREKSKSYQAIVEASCLHDISSIFTSTSTSRIRRGKSRRQPTVYLAAPHRNVDKNKSIKEALVQAGFSVKVPFDEVSKHRVDTPDSIRSVCVDAINASQFLVVDLDTYGLDTAWELGYAEGLGRYVIGYNQDVFLTTDERHINRRIYTHNFMHGWDRHPVHRDMASLAQECKDKVIYVAGSFSNPELEKILNETLTASAKKVVFPKHHVENVNQLPRDYPLAERGETNLLLEGADMVVVALPRYGMDCSWQIGFATAKNKQVCGILLDDDGIELTRQSFWEHWMHAWKSKIRVTGNVELRAVLRGLSDELDLTVNAIAKAS